MQLQLRAHHDHRTAGVVHALAEQVLAEAALLALQHVGQRLQRPLVGAGDGPAAAAVVEQSIHRLLQHALLVADDDIRRAQFDQPLQTVVAVDDAAVQVVEVGRGEAAAIQRHQRAQLRRNDGDDRHDHPLRPVAGLDERLHDLQPLGELLRLQLGLRLRDFLLQLVTQLLQIDAGQHLADGLRADTGGEAIQSVLVLCRQILLLRQQLPLLQGRQAGLGDDVGLEVEHPLDILQRHVEEQADTGRQRLQEPDVRHRCGQLDVAHALAAHLGERHLHAALLADDALVFHPLVLAAQALVILHRTEDTGAEQAVALRLEGAVVDGLRLLDLAVGPRKDLLRRGDADADGIEGLRLSARIEDVGDFLIHPCSPKARGPWPPCFSRRAGGCLSRRRPAPSHAYAGVTPPPCRTR